MELPMIVIRQFGTGHIAIVVIIIGGVMGSVLIIMMEVIMAVQIMVINIIFRKSLFL